MPSIFMLILDSDCAPIEWKRVALERSKRQFSEDLAELKTESKMQ